MNHNNGNGNGVKLDRSKNGAILNQLTSQIRSKILGESLEDLAPTPSPHKRSNKSSPDSFESPAILEQSKIWSRSILWGLMGVTTVAVVWASVANIQEAIPATGKLEPVAP